MKNKTCDFDVLRKNIIDIFSAGLKGADPGEAIKKHLTLENNTLVAGSLKLDLSEFENIRVIGAGKAGAAMALEIEHIFNPRISIGSINVKYDHTENLETIELVQAGHPVPDENGKKGAKRLLEIAESADEKTLILCLISGGGSALAPLPCHGISLAEKQETTRILLSCGASIHDINTIRKHLSLIKGGGVARAAYPATIISLILSDVVGDDLDIIASGPTVPDTGTFADCKRIIEAYHIADDLPENVIKHIEKGCAGTVPETSKPDAPYFKKVYNQIIGNNLNSLVQARAMAESLGYNTLILSSMIEGETRDIAKMHAAIAKQAQETGDPVPLPACIISGGETTVTLEKHGLGGRNQEFVLAAAIEISRLSNMVVLSAGTDGTDGPTDAAGAIADTRTVKKAIDLNLSPEKFLCEHDSYHFFQQLDDLVITGPTNTNVMDLRVFLVTEKSGPGKNQGIHPASPGF